MAASNPAEVLEIVLENVLRFLTSNGDRNAASLVCKSWYRAEGLTRLDLKIANCYAVSPSQVINRFESVTSLTIRGFLGWVSSRRAGSSSSDCPAHFSPWVNQMTKAYRGLEKVYLKGMYVANDDLGVLAHSFPDLKELVLVCCEGFGASGLAIVARECKQIRVFELIKSEVEAEVDYFEEFDANDVVDWISCFPESSSCLESFIIDVMYLPINFEALEQLVTRSPSLKKLTFSCDVSILQLQRLIVLAPQLTHLGRGWVDSFPELFARAPHTFNFIHVANFVDMDHDHDHDDANFAAHMAAYCKSLESISGLKGDYVQAIVPHCANNLKTLDLSSIKSYINANEILHCHKLQTLKVWDSIGDGGLKAVATTCKELREFLLRDESKFSRVSEVGLLAIFKGCRKLQCIKYVGHRMTNATLLAISENCPDLRVCILTQGRSWYKYVPGEPFDIGIRAIVKNCKKITRLKVHGLLTDRAFEYIGEYGKSLRSLSFVFNEESDMGLKYVLDGCSKLQKLELMNCPFDKQSFEFPFEDEPDYDRFCTTLTEDLSPSCTSYGEMNSLFGLRADLPHYYDMNSLLRMKYCRATGACCGKISRVLLDRFGLEAHVMLYYYDHPAHEKYKTRLHNSMNKGHMKIFLKR